MFHAVDVGELEGEIQAKNAQQRRGLGDQGGEGQRSGYQNDGSHDGKEWRDDSGRERTVLLRWVGAIRVNVACIVQEVDPRRQETESNDADRSITDDGGVRKDSRSSRSDHHQPVFNPLSGPHGGDEAPRTNTQRNRRSRHVSTLAPEPFLRRVVDEAVLEWTYAESPMERNYRVVVAKPGLDGHDRGAKVIARALRDAGFEVVYTGLHQTPEQIVQAVIQEDADALGLSLLSGAHLVLVPRVISLLAAADREDVVIVVGGIIPEDDIAPLTEMGVARVFTPGSPLGEIGTWLEATLDQRELTS